MEAVNTVRKRTDFIQRAVGTKPQKVSTHVTRQNPMLMTLWGSMEYLCTVQENVCIYVMNIR